MFYGITHTAVFFLYFISFRICVRKQETRVHPSHLRRKSDKQRGFRA